MHNAKVRDYPQRQRVQLVTDTSTNGLGSGLMVPGAIILDGSYKRGPVGDAGLSNALIAWAIQGVLSTWI